MGAPTKAREGLLQLLELILRLQSELELTDSQLGTLAKLYWDADESKVDSVDALSQHLSHDQLHRALVLFEESAGSLPAVPAPVRIDDVSAASFEKRIDDKDLIELYVATKAAERMIAWARTFGFFVAIPLGLILLIATLFGISKVEDVRNAADRVDAKVQQAEAKLDSAVANAQHASERANQILASANEQIAALKTRLTNQAQQLSTLDQKVTKLAESLSFGEDTGVSKDLQERLRQRAAAFLGYFEELGYTPKTPLINVKTKTDISGALSYYDSQSNTIFVQPNIISDQFPILREYSHHILYSSLSFDALNPKHHELVSLVPIEFGLANYFSASFLDDPHLGADAARALKEGTPYLFNLENNDYLSTLVTTDYAAATSLQNAWGGLFWDIRQALIQRKLGRLAADKLLYETWCAQPDESNNMIGRRFVVNLLSKAQIQLGKKGKSMIEDLLLRRGLKASDITNPS